MVKNIIASRPISFDKLLLYFAFLGLTNLTLQAQTTIISPTGAGGFELGATLAANGWSATTGTATQNQWICSTGATAGFSGTNAAYITNNTASVPPPHTYAINATRISHVYRNFTVPAGETIINLSFSWISNGDAGRDKMRVFIIPSTTTPVYGTALAAAGTAPTGVTQLGANFNAQTTWTTATYTLPTAYAGTTCRLVFEWSNNNNTGNQPPGGVDNISLTSAAPAPILGDECAIAIPLTVSSTCSYTTYTNAANTASAGIPAPGCASYSGGDIWFSAVVPFTGILTVDTQTGVITDGGMAFYTGSCGALTLLSCDDDSSTNGLMPYLTASGLTPGSTVYIRFWEYSNDNNGTFGICATSPTCIVPSINPTSSITTNSATINWTALTPAPAVGYEYYYSTSSTTPTVAGTATTATSIPLTGLTPNTVYYVFVRSNCGGGNYSGWSAYDMFSTGYCPSVSTATGYYISDFSTTGGTANITNNGTTLSASGYGNYTAMSVSQQNFGAINFSSTFVGGTFGFNIWVDWNDDMDFNDTGELVYASNGYVSSATGSFSIPGTTAVGNHRMRIRADYLSTNPTACGTITDGETEDYTLTVLPPPPCSGNPTFISVNITSQTAATVTWTAPAPAPANGYQYYMSTSSVSPSALATPTGSLAAGVTSLSLSGLTPLTTYYIWVRSNCGGALGLGVWVGATYWTQPNCAVGNSTGTTTLACPSVISGGLSLNGADPTPIGCTASSCVDLEATYLDMKQTTTYTVATIPYSPPYQFSCLKNPVSVNVDDKWSPVINLPFNFCYYGNNYNQCTIGSNGVVSFDLVNNAPGSYSTWSFANNLPNNTMFLNTIFGVYHDIDPSLGGEIGWELITLNSGCRALVASWNDIPMFSAACNSSLYTGMIVLYENTNIIDVYVKTKSTCASWNDGNAIVGIQNSTGTQAIVAPGRNGLDANWNVTNEAWRFTPAGPSLTTLAWYEGNTATGPVIGTTPVINVCPTATTNYTAKVVYTFCDGTTMTKTDYTTVTVTNGKNWNGSVSTNWNTAANWTPVGVPNNTDCVVIPVTPNNPIISGSSYNGLAGFLTVKNGATLTMLSSNSLTVTNWVKVEPTGNFIIENSASLLQVNNDTNTGNITYKRTAQNIRMLDYVYWSSPVSNFNINSLVAPLVSGPIYTWNPTVANPNGGQGNWQGAAGSIMSAGKGYIARGPSSFTSMGANLNATFVGVPNNGNITTPISRGSDTNTAFHTGLNGIEITNYSDNANLIGNPYPSALRASQFLFDNNTKIEGNIRLWTHGTLPAQIANPFYDSFVYNYTAGDYLTYNFTGSSCCPAAGSDLFIGAGQGFFVQMKDGPAASNTVSFTNSMRNYTYSNSLFYRPGQTPVDVESIERNRIWVDLIDANSSSDRTLVGYIEGATQEQDSFFDCKTSTTAAMSVYSLIGNEPFIIQGRALPFEVTDEIPLGMNLPTAGSYSLAIAGVDGLFNTQNIYLKDHELQLIHDLKTTPYQFAAESGKCNNRFQLIFTNGALGAAQFELGNTIQVAANESIQIKSVGETIQSVVIYDVLGRKLAENKQVNTKELLISNLQKYNTALLVEVTTVTGAKTTKKIIY
ncbi:MAG: putative adhesin [Bacteroidota bacterium]